MCRQSVRSLRYRNWPSLYWGRQSMKSWHCHWLESHLHVRLRIVLSLILLTLFVHATQSYKLTWQKIGSSLSNRFIISRIHHNLRNHHNVANKVSIILLHIISYLNKINAFRERWLIWSITLYCVSCTWLQMSRQIQDAKIMSLMSYVKEFNDAYYICHWKGSTRTDALIYYWLKRYCVACG